MTDYSELQNSVETDSSQIENIITEIKTMKNLTNEERIQKLKVISEMLNDNQEQESIQRLNDVLGDSLSDFLGDPRNFVNFISFFFDCIKSNTEQAQICAQRYLQEKRIGNDVPTSSFDWTMVDILLSQLSHLSGSNAIFTDQMKDSMIFSLFPQSCETHFIQDLVCQVLSLSIGETIETVRQRMQGLSQSSLSKVTHLANLLYEIQEKYESEINQSNCSVSFENVVNGFQLD